MSVLTEISKTSFSDNRSKMLVGAMPLTMSSLLRSIAESVKLEQRIIRNKSLDNDFRTTIHFMVMRYKYSIAVALTHELLDLPSSFLD